MDMLKIGVIGTGHMGINHVRVLSEDKHFNLLGIYDLNPERATEVSEKYQVRAFQDLDELLDEVEAVVIAAPSYLHKELGLKAAEHKVNALIEKPLATSVEDAQELVAAFREQQLKLSVGHIERFNPVFRELQKLTDRQRIYYIETSRFSPFSNSGRITDTSVVEDLMIHDVDLVCALMGGAEPASIHGRGEVIKSGQTDFATCLMDFQTRSHAIVNVSRISQNKERSIRVYTDDSFIAADLLNKTLEVYESTNITVDATKNNSYKQNGIIKKIYVPIVEPLRQELNGFYDMVVNDEAAEVDGETAVRALRICEQVSNRIKKTI